MLKAMNNAITETHIAMITAFIVTASYTGFHWTPVKAAQAETTPTPQSTDLVSPAAPAPAQRIGMTVEQVRTEIENAQKRRLEAAKPDIAYSKTLTEKFGVRDFSIRRSAAGYMLDFRFRVVDADKALTLFDHRIKPYLLTERTKIRLPVPMAAKVGAFRPTNRGRNIKADKTYYMLFGNPDSYVKPGQKVSVVIGGFRAEHLTVQ